MTQAQAREAAEAVIKHGSIRAAARALGMAHTTVQCRLERARQMWPSKYPTKAEAEAKKVADNLGAHVLAEIKRAPATLRDLADALGVAPVEIQHELEAARDRGVSVNVHNGVWRFDSAPPLGSSRNDMAELVTDRDGIISIGAIGDTHLGSKYERLDCLNDYYNEVQNRGIRHVLHAGNWIDGEASFNRHDLLVHGMDGQMQHMASVYPRRNGVETWAITGADHEGWYARQFGVDVGRYAANVMREAGRRGLSHRQVHAAASWAASPAPVRRPCGPGHAVRPAAAPMGRPG